MATPSLSALPAELIAFVIDHLDRLKDLSALARTDRKLYSSANPIVYKRAVSQGDAWPLAWAAHCGVAGTLKRVLAAGVGPDHAFVDCLPLDDWKRVNAAARQQPAAAAAPGGDDHVDWDADNGSESTAEWSIETEDDSDHAGTSTTHQPSSNSNSEPWSWGPVANDSDRDSDVWMDELAPPRSDGASSTLDEQERESDAGPAALGDNMIVRRYNALHLAVQAGHHDIVEILLDHGASVNAACERLCECTRLYGLLNAAECPQPVQSPPQWSPLHLAICHSRPETAKLLLSRGATPIMDPPTDGDESQCITALHHAATMGLTDVVRYLVDNGIQKEIDVRDAKTLTPLYHAYAERRWETIALLIELGADINVDTKVYLPYSTITPLGEACRLGHFDTADRLVDLGADPNRGFIITELGKGLTPLHLCAMPSARPVRAPPSPEDPFLRMLEEGQKGVLMMQAIAKLISKGAVLDMVDCSGDTPLIAAAQNHNVPALRALIAAGVNVHERNTVGRTALMQAIMGPQNPIAATLNDENPEPLAQSVQILIAGGARLDERDSEGNTILHLVFKGSNTFHSMQKAALRILMNSPGVADLSQVRDKDHHTPLQLAFAARNLEACDVLVRRGCIRGTLDQSELMAMFIDSLASPGEQDALDFVLDLDVNGSLTTDPAIFTALLAKSKYTAIRAARAIAQRGLPAITPADATKLLCMAVRMGETALAGSLMACGGDLRACEGHFHPILPISSDTPRGRRRRVD
ncbi:ankyrin repeat-containing domain protein [Cercophora newfieldiana]|uniref:Ankyrin repeat-containing domain protein n=1 Tax=Cercophora newfieldiana TaxID=92897 RepID=A0AA39XZN2_9PEZI|nr:ankyrin repeat-containing domain protein [Cercophora newfieldiana]